VLAIVLEVQLSRDPDKRRSWPAYVVGLRARLDCPACVLVITETETIARWCREPIELGPGNVFRALVVGPASVPAIDDVAVAERDPELAVLSALARGEGPHAPCRADRPCGPPRCTTTYSSSSRRRRCSCTCVGPQRVVARTSRRVKRTFARAVAFAAARSWPRLSRWEVPATSHSTQRSITPSTSGRRYGSPGRGVRDVRDAGGDDRQDVVGALGAIGGCRTAVTVIPSS